MNTQSIGPVHALHEKLEGLFARIAEVRSHPAFGQFGERGRRALLEDYRLALIDFIAAVEHDAQVKADARPAPTPPRNIVETHIIDANGNVLARCDDNTFWALGLLTEGWRQLPSIPGTVAP